MFSLATKNTYFVRDHSDAPQNTHMRRTLYNVSSKQFIYRYIDDVLSLKNTKYAEYLEFIHPRELEIMEKTMETAHTWVVISTLTMKSLLLGFTINGKLRFSIVRRLRFTVNP